MIRLSIIFLIAFSLSTEAKDKRRVSQIDAIMEHSGLDRQTRQMANDLDRGLLEVEKTSKNRRTIRAVRKTMVNGLKKVDLNKKVKRDLKRQLNKKEILNLISWYYSPLAQKISKLEVTEQARGSRGLEEFAKALRTNQATKERVQKVLKVAQLVGAIELEVELARATTLATLIGVNTSKPRAQRVSSNQIEKIVEKSVPFIYKTTVNTAIITALRAYRALSNRELDKYIKHLETDHGQKFTQIVSASMREAYAIAIFGLHKKIANELSYEN